MFLAIQGRHVNCLLAEHGYVILLALSIHTETVLQNLEGLLFPNMCTQIGDSDYYGSLLAIRVA